MKLPDIDESLIPLPPLDGDAEDDLPAEPEDLDPNLAPEIEGFSHDDAPDETLDLGESIEQTWGEAAPWSEADENAEVDVGEDALVGDDGDRVADRTQDDDNLPGIAPPCDFDVAEEATGLTSEQAEDGPLDPSSLTVDDELPPMDADEEGDLGDKVELPADFAAAITSADTHADDFSWRAVEESLMPLPIGPADFDATVLIDPAVQEGAVLLTSRHGVQRVGRDKPPQPRNLWREHGMSPVGVVAREHHFLAALGRKGCEQVLWVVTPSGRLMRGEEDGTVWEDRGPVPGTCFRALCARKDGALFLLCGSGVDLYLACSEGGGSWRKQNLVTTSPFCDDESRLWVAASRTEVVIGHGSGVVITRDGGRSFHELAGAKGALAGVFTAEGAGALVVAVRHPDEGVFLARSTDRDELEIVARIEAGIETDHGQEQELDGYAGDAAESPPPLALAADEERGVVWTWWRGWLSAWGPRNLQ